MNLLQVFKQDWPDDAETASLCASVHFFLEQTSTQDHYTFAQIRDAVGISDARKLAEALLYMSNPRLKLIKIIFFKPDGDEITEIEPNSSGEFIDETTDEELDSRELLMGFERGTFYSNRKAAS